MLIWFYVAYLKTVLNIRIDYEYQRSKIQKSAYKEIDETAAKKHAFT